MISSIVFDEEHQKKNRRNVHHMMRRYQLILSQNRPARPTGGKIELHAF